MTRRASLRAICALAVAAGASLGCRPAKNPVLFVGVGQRPDVSRPTRLESAYELTPGRTFGAVDGLLGFASVGPMAVNQSGRLAVFDGGTCQIVFLSLLGPPSPRRVSGCGDGPGELRDVRALTWLTDTVVAYDATKQALLWLDQNGTELRRLVPALLSEPNAPFGLDGMAAVNDTLFVLGLLLPPAHGGSSDDDLLALVNSQTGRTIRRFAGDPVVSRRSRGNALRNVSFCISHSAKGDFLAVLNHWAFEGLIYDLPTLTIRSHFLVELPWAGPVHVARDPRGVTRSGISYPMVGCSDQGVIYRVHNIDLTEKPVKTIGGYVEVRGFDGRLLYSHDLLAADWRLTGMAAAGWRGQSTLPLATHYRITTLYVRCWFDRDLE